MSVRDSWHSIVEVLQENANSVYRALRKPASDAHLQRLESKVGSKLPRVFIQSVKIHDGLRNSYLGEVRLFNYWALLPIAAILQEWVMMINLQAECEFGGCQFKVSPRIKNDAHWRYGWVPFLNADGDKMIIDLDPAKNGKVGQIIEWSNSGSFPTRVVANSFDEWLAVVAEKFSNRQFRLSEFGSILMYDE